ncbi:MAG: hypothetical protein LBT66_02775 [Methanobrevibacter sp.]|jgi:hypothetical protein|nr:hypothetical protein [Candidatus Methanovirga meridionalis]
MFLKNFGFYISILLNLYPLDVNSFNQLKERFSPIILLKVFLKCFFNFSTSLKFFVELILLISFQTSSIGVKSEE